MRGRRARIGAVLVLLAWALLLAAWLMTNPPFAAPDEADHYIRAVGISEGHLIGRKDPNAHVGATARQVAWTRQATRIVELPAGLDPLPYTCQTGSGDLSAACLDRAQQNRTAVTLATPVGNYQPLPYVLPGALMRAAGSPPGALRLGRAGVAVLAFALLAVALLALYDGAYAALSIVGLLLAVTPMVLFCAASLNGSGVEIAGAIALFSCLLRVTRTDPVPRGWWVATALSGAVFALSRPASPLWVALAIGVVIAWAGRKVSVARLVHDRASWVAAGVLVAAVVLTGAWEALYGTHAGIDTSALHAGLVAGVHQWWRALPELVGKFGYINVKLPLVLPLVWFALAIGLFAVAIRGEQRDRLALVVLIPACLVMPVVSYALLTRPTGFGLQGRQMLPALVILPLLAGEISYRRRQTLQVASIRFFTLVVPVTVAVVQAGAWYVNAKRFAVGNEGPVWFVMRASWSPPAGWIFWLVAVMLATACIASVAIIGQRASSPEKRHCKGLGKTFAELHA